MLLVLSKVFTKPSHVLIEEYLIPIYCPLSLLLSLSIVEVSLLVIIVEIWISVDPLARFLTNKTELFSKMS